MDKSGEYQNKTRKNYEISATVSFGHKDIPDATVRNTTYNIIS
jgi:hypothetical protein